MHATGRGRALTQDDAYWDRLREGFHESCNWSRVGSGAYSEHREIIEFKLIPYKKRGGAVFRSNIRID